MRILFVSESTGVSGGANQMILSARELIKRGHEIYAAVNKNGDTAARLDETGVKTEHMLFLKKKEIFGAFNLNKIITKVKPDIVHAHHSRAHSVCLIAKHFMDFKLVVTRRVIFPIPRNPFSLYKYRSSKINRFIAVCDDIKNELVKAGLSPERIVVIYSGVDFSRFEKSRTLRETVKYSKPFNVITIGNYSSFKGHDYLIKAVKIISASLSPEEISFTIVGKFTEKLREQVEAAGIDSYVKIMGERKDVPELLASAHLMVVPSLQEGICGVCIEAAASMVPVIGTEIGGIPEVIEKGKTGFLVKAASGEAIANAVKNVFSDYAGAMAFTRPAYDSCLEKFSLSRVVDKLEKFYSELI